MIRQQQSVVLAGMLAVALALSGCKGMGENAGAAGGSTQGSATGSGPAGAGSANTPMGTSGSSGASGAMGSGSAATQPRESATGMPNSTVLAIETVPKPAAAGATGALGSSGAAGATGSPGSGQAYRITLRLDDGSTQVITQESIPDFRSGDRVQVESGVIQR